MHAQKLFAATFAFTAAIVSAIPAPAPEISDIIDATEDFTEFETFEADDAMPGDDRLSKRAAMKGVATVYQQLGVAGSCGNYHKDADHIVALGPKWMANKNIRCGHRIKVEKTGGRSKGNAVIAVIQDTCPGCEPNHVDLSVGAWNKLTNNAAFGKVDVLWHFCSNGKC